MAETALSKMRLADAISQLRAEISRARQEGQGKDVRFAAKAIEVELSLDFGWTAEAKADVSKWVPFVDVGLKGGGSENSLHKVKLTLEIDAAGDPSGRLIFDEGGPAPVNPSS